MWHWLAHETSSTSLFPQCKFELQVCMQLGLLCTSQHCWTTWNKDNTYCLNQQWVKKPSWPRIWPLSTAPLKAANRGWSKWSQYSVNLHRCYERAVLHLCQLSCWQWQNACDYKNQDFAHQALKCGRFWLSYDKNLPSKQHSVETRAQVVSHRSCMAGWGKNGTHMSTQVFTNQISNSIFNAHLIS